MNKQSNKIKLSPELYSTCVYFIPRFLFLNSIYAPQLHWGDIVQSLDCFPNSDYDLSSGEFWETWMEQWIKTGNEYVNLAESSGTKFGKNRALRSACACFHCAEFMYFSDRQKKIRLRQRIREYFLEYISRSNLLFEYKSFEINNVNISYFSIYPEKKFNLEKSKFPTVILSNGLDSMTEVEILSISEFFLERGIAVILFDGPGQGLNLGKNPLVLSIEVVITKLLDEIQLNEKLDFNCLGFVGISFGGYFSLRVANLLSEKFKCCVNISGGIVVNDFSKLPRRLKEDFKFAFGVEDNYTMESILDSMYFDFKLSKGIKILSVHGKYDDIFPIEHIMSLDEQLGNQHELIVYDNDTHVCLNHINQYMIDVADWIYKELV